jgi:hypothetical protein
MRSISSGLLLRIEKLNQTIYENADPRMYAKILRVTKNLQVHTVASAEAMGTIDLAVNWPDLSKDPTEIWIAEVINRAGVVKVYDYDEEMDFAAPARMFDLTTVGVNARVKDIAIAFDGTVTDGQVATTGAPYIAWLERTTSYDSGYVIRWDGTGTQPAATEVIKVGRA